jgi:hypothetical protein
MLEPELIPLYKLIAGDKIVLISLSDAVRPDATDDDALATLSRFIYHCNFVSSIPACFIFQTLIIHNHLVLI